MTSSYDESLTALYRAPHESFVSERTRLAAELKADGDKAGAARLAKLARPTISAWIVNQLWWHARKAFDALFESAQELRTGKLAARARHREALAQLGKHAQKLLSESGHAATEATLRRVTMTLSGLAAAGGFDPEPEGALSKDRDPPGFDAFGGEAFASVEPAPKAAHTAAAREEAAREKASAKKRAAEAHAKKQAARKQLDASVHEAKRELSEREAGHDKLKNELAAAAREVERARAAVENAQAKLAAFEREE
jgi:Tfp pilus assembly protein FimV